MSEITRILHAIEKGDVRAACELLPLLNDDLHWLASQRRAQTLAGPAISAPIDESCSCEVDSEYSRRWRGGGHFYAAAAEALRRIVVDHARQGPALEPKNATCFPTGRPPDPAPDDIVKLDGALTLLARKDPIAAQLIQLRYFAGLSSAQAADALGITTKDAEQTWSAARDWLFDRIQVQGGAPCRNG
jgi:RNA polymerase sigma factor (TIGR02999 family)